MTSDALHRAAKRRTVARMAASNVGRSQLRVGLIGCGTIAPAYLVGCRMFPVLDVVAVADLDLQRARDRAEAFHVPQVYTVEDLLASEEVDLVVNLTVPAAHADVTVRALDAGKHVYVEKPLATDVAAGREVLRVARARGLMVGSAPDTFLGGGLQTARAVLDEGAIGRPTSFFAAMASHGPEAWHVDPAFFYAPGAGPTFDMGPYYLTALVDLLGPVASVASVASIAHDQRVVGSGPRAGQKIEVETPTHVSALLTMESGVVGTLTTSFDLWASEHPRIEIHGTEGTLSLPDPNTFGGPLRACRAGERDFREIPLRYGRTDNRRGLGVADLAHAILAGRPARASAERAFHVLDVMASILEAAREAKTVGVRSTVPRSSPLDPGLDDGVLEPGWRG